MTARIHSTYTTEMENFTQNNPWYQVYLNYAYKNGMINKAYYNCNVRQKASHSQFVEIFSNALLKKGLRAINTISDNTIPDVDSSKDYAAAVYKLYQAGILTVSDVYGNLSPSAYVTRTEAVTIISRMAESNHLAVSRFNLLL